MRARSLSIAAAAAACGNASESGSPVGADGGPEGGGDAAAAVAACDLAGTVCRVAGTGSLGFNGDGRPAAETDLYLPTVARPGPDGRLYVMDFNNQRLRAIEPDGTMTTVAGNGFHNVSTCDVPALESPMENPIDFGFGADARTYLAPIHDPRVLAVDRDGTLRCVAGSGGLGGGGDGGPAAEASFSELTALAIAADGAILVADCTKITRCRIRTLRGGVVDAFAGRSGQEGYRDGPAADALFRRTGFLALGPDGSLYLADAGNHAIRRVTPDGTVETVVGIGQEGFAGDGGPAAAALLRRPEGVAVAGDGTLYIADSGNHRIRRVAPDGMIETIAGTGERGLAGDGGPAAEASFHGPTGLHLDGDDLYVADTRNSVVRRIRLR